MKAELQIFTYEEYPIEFSVNGDVLINANQMAVAFQKRVHDYTRLDSTKEFVKALCKSGNSRFIDEFTPSGYYVKTQVGKGGGTWIHRHIAIDFAMWLSPEFRVWVIKTIDDLMHNRKQEHQSYFAHRKSHYEDRNRHKAEMKRYWEEVKQSDAYKEYLAHRAEYQKSQSRLSEQERGFFGEQKQLFGNNEPGES